MIIKTNRTDSSENEACTLCECVRYGVVVAVQDSVRPNKQTNKRAEKQQIARHNGKYTRRSLSGVNDTKSSLLFRWSTRYCEGTVPMEKNE